MTVLTSEMIEVLQICYGNLGIFNKTLMPESFSASYSSLHRQMLKALESPHQKIVIAAPRGLGKTTTVRGLITRAILYRDYDFIPYISNAGDVAELQTENIKMELRTNSEIRKLFGDIAVNTDDPEIESTFGKKAWVAFGRTLVLPRGAHQQIRGLIYKRYRPQLIIVDDLEKREELENPENRRKLKEWFHSDLEKCVDRYSNKWRIIYIDTLKHHDSLLQELLDSPDWLGLRLDLCDDSYNSYVPELISTEELQQEAESHRKNGTMHIFFMEYRNMPTSKENMSFDPQHFRYFTEQDLTGKKLENVVIVDPAKTAQIQSADSAIVGIGVDYKSGSIYIRDIVHGKMYPDEIYEQMFAMRRRLNAHAVGIEVTGLEEFIKQPIMNEMMKRGPQDSFEPIWLTARGGDPGGDKGKIKRIGSLVPYYRQGYMFHNKTNCAVLEGQLTTFPRSALLDVADAVAYIIEMLEMGSRYFDAPEEEDHDIEAEYEELEYDDALDASYLRF